MLLPRIATFDSNSARCVFHAPADSATIGTGVQVFGQLPPVNIAGTPTTMYAVDGKNVSSFTPSDVPAANTPTLQNVSFFEIHDLFVGDHELLITNLNGTSPNEFFLDFFLVEVPANATGSTSTTSTTASQSSGTAASTTSSTGSGTPTGAAAVNAADSGGHKNVGAIAGGVVGGAVFLLLVSVIVWLWMRLKRVRSTSKHRQRSSHLRVSG